jgi:hypothetical protein
MTETTEDEVLVKAKQLAHDECRQWDSGDIDQDQERTRPRRRQFP